MSARPPAIWTTGSTEVFETGTWRSATPVHRDRPSPCHGACPVDGDIAHWLQQLASGDTHGAWTTLVANNPFPAIAGRVCHHPCEAVCNRREHDEAVSICALERYVGDTALSAGWSLPAAEKPCSGSVAVVGGGPSGLAAACYLRQAGHAVCIYEAQAELGGLLRYGIPPYRLPPAVRDGEIKRIHELGVEVRGATSIDGWAGIEGLRADYDAVYVALGAGRTKRLPQLDYAQPWMVDGASYLAAASTARDPAFGPRVVVIGGGSAAIDAARSARRHGAEVWILALESEAEMPAQRQEVVEAREEGVNFAAGAMLQSVEPDPSGVALHCVRVRFEGGAERGEFHVEPLPDSDFTLTTDTVIGSIGQDPELGAGVPDALLDSGLLRVDGALQTGLDGVFAGGDVATMDRFVTHAVGLGKRAATSIHRYLCGQRSAPAPGATVFSGFDAVNTHYHPHAPREHQQSLPAAERIAAFDEVQHGLAEAAALAESARCFSCGACTHCDNCLYYCPDMAIIRNNGGYAVKTAYCKGCGLCVQECPTGAVTMQDDQP